MVTYLKNAVKNDMDDKTEAKELLRNVISHVILKHGKDHFERMFEIRDDGSEVPVDMTAFTRENGAKGKPSKRPLVDEDSDPEPKRRRSTEAAWNAASLKLKEAEKLREVERQEKQRDREFQLELRKMELLKVMVTNGQMPTEKTIEMLMCKK